MSDKEGLVRLRRRPRHGHTSRAPLSPPGHASDGHRLEGDERPAGRRPRQARPRAGRADRIRQPQVRGAPDADAVAAVERSPSLLPEADVHRDLSSPLAHDDGPLSAPDLGQPTAHDLRRGCTHDVEADRSSRRPMTDLCRAQVPSPPVSACVGFSTSSGYYWTLKTTSHHTSCISGPRTRCDE